MSDPVLAKDDEQPTFGGVWHTYCATCRRLTTWAAFMDEHGCDVGGGCTACRYIPHYRPCELSEAIVTEVPSIPSVDALWRKP